MSTTIVGHCFCTILHLHFIHRDMYVCVTHTYICDDDIHTCGRGRRTRERVLGALGIRSSWRGQKWPPFPNASLHESSVFPSPLFHTALGNVHMRTHVSLPSTPRRDRHAAFPAVACCQAVPASLARVPDRADRLAYIFAAPVRLYQPETSR